MAERQHVMGMPVSVDVREDAVAPRAVQAVFTWLAFVDEMFSTYRADSEASAASTAARSQRGTRTRWCGKCSRAASGSGSGQTATSTLAPAGSSIPRGS